MARNMTGSEDSALTLADCAVLSRMTAFVLQSYYDEAEPMTDDEIKAVKRVEAKLVWLKREAELREGQGLCG